ncbi:FMRFamide receptor [Aplysia californica]|uniref:FMRFamide receptor n=1 Tax=Aplysia californica TaxID=6500 RepID=A0ABM0JCS3_APLCA|nr:FMRFamide receptor [Aplysia californica]
MVNITEVLAKTHAALLTDSSNGSTGGGVPGMGSTNHTTDLFLTTTAAAAMPPGRPAGPPEYVLNTIFVCEHVLMPIVCCLGILGNGLSLCVLTRREMAAATTCFLTAMAVSDLLLLVMQVPTFFGLNSDIKSSMSFKRFIRYYAVIRYVMSNVFITCTGWLTVAVTTERFISLRFMFHPRLVCTIPRARVAIIGIFLFSFIFHFSKFFEYVPNPDLSAPNILLTTHLVHTPAYETYVHIANIALAAIIPVFLLIVANSFLIFFLATHRRRMLRHKASASTNMTSVDMLHVSAIVVATVLVFIACHSVGVVLALTIASKGRRWVFGQPVYIALKHVNTVLVMVNSSINFLLYCAISRKFRKTFVSVFYKRLSRRDTWTSAMPLSENSTGTAGPPPSTRVANGKVYSSSSKSVTSNGSSHSGHSNAIRADV